MADNYNISRYTCTINVAAGTYNETITLPKYNSTTGRITITGAGKNQTKITYTNRKAILLQFAVSYTLTQMAVELVTTPDHTELNNAAVDCRNSGDLSLTSCKLRVVSGKDIQTHCLWVQNSRATLNDVDFETTLTDSTTGNRLNCINNQNSYIGIVSNCTINGTFNTILYVNLLGVFYKMRSTAPVITGTAIGRRYAISGNSIVDLGNMGEEYFPGSINGTTTTGGQYL